MENKEVKELVELIFDYAYYNYSKRTYRFINYRDTILDSNESIENEIKQIKDSIKTLEDEKLINYKYQLTNLDNWYNDKQRTEDILSTLLCFNERNFINDEKYIKYFGELLGNIKTISFLNNYICELNILNKFIIKNKELSLTQEKNRIYFKDFKNLNCAKIAIEKELHLRNIPLSNLTNIRIAKNGKIIYKLEEGLILDNNFWSLVQKNYNSEIKKLS